MRLAPGLREKGEGSSAITIFFRNQDPMNQNFLNSATQHTTELNLGLQQHDGRRYASDGHARPTQARHARGSVSEAVRRHDGGAQPSHYTAPGQFLAAYRTRRRTLVRTRASGTLHVLSARTRECSRDDRRGPARRTLLHFSSRSLVPQQCRR